MILRILLILILGGITYLSLTPVDNIQLGNDKIGHIIAYTVLTLNLGLIIHPHRRKLLLFGTLAFVYGILMECGQYFVPGRDVSLYDLIANASGVMCGILILTFWGDRIHRIMQKAKII